MFVSFFLKKTNYTRFVEMSLKVSRTFCDVYILVPFRNCVSSVKYSVFVILSDFSLLLTLCLWWGFWFCFFIPGYWVLVGGLAGFGFVLGGWEWWWVFCCCFLFWFGFLGGCFLIFHKRLRTKPQYSSWISLTYCMLNGDTCLVAMLMWYGDHMIHCFCRKSCVTLSSWCVVLHPCV